MALRFVARHLAASFHTALTFIRCFMATSSIPEPIPTSLYVSSDVYGSVGFSYVGSFWDIGNLHELGALVL